MSDIFEQMIAQHTIAGDNDRKNALYEVMQQVVLSGLYRGGFFKEAAFYGGTCLRIFHGLRRYSEDMDFSLLAKNPNFTSKIVVLLHPFSREQETPTIQFGSVSSVGSERFLHTEEVDSSNLPQTTERASYKGGFSFCPETTESFLSLQHTILSEGVR